MKTPRLILLASVGLLACQKSPPPPPAALANGEQVLVAEVSKADEIIVEHQGTRHTVRLLGIHAFASIKYDADLQALGQNALDAAREGLTQKQVSLALGETSKDAHGRYLAYVKLGDDDFNLRLIEQGLAVVYTEYPFSKEDSYLRVETDAREKELGLWQNPKAEKLVASLRSLWQQARTGRGDPRSNDTWLASQAHEASPPSDPGEVPEPGLP